jgi:uncharacterized protein (TIGR02271 family)
MDLRGKLTRGMHVVGSDQTDYGTVERYDDETVYVDGRPIPFSAFDRLEQHRLYVGQHGARHFRKEDRKSDLLTSPLLQGHELQEKELQEDELRIPLVEERLTVGTRAIELGEVEIRKTVETEQVSVPVVLRQDYIHVRLVDIDERPIALHEVPDAFTQDLIRVPVRGEEAVIRKEAVVTGEVAVSRTEVIERRTVSETVRQVTVDVAANFDDARPGLRQHFDDLQARLQQAGGATFRARDFADAESNYRLGFAARHDPRNADRSFEDVETELREQHRADGKPEGTWATDRDELQAGWERGRR